MRHALLASVAAGALFAPVPLGAAEPPDYAGTFVVDDPAQRDAALAAAVEAGAEQYPKLVRGIVRGRLEEVVKASEWFEFQPGAGTMTIRTDANTTGWTTDLAGSETAVEGADGKETKLARWMEGGSLRARGCRALGCSHFAFVLSADQQIMTLTVRTESEKLDEPLEYAVRYRRK